MQTYQGYSRALLDLIDTLWNVKARAPPRKSARAFDLIDTLWNVKFFISQCFHSSSRFNRYIVECKVISENLSLSKVVRFNRYIVECKGRSMQDSTRPRIRI